MFPCLFHYRFESQDVCLKGLTCLRDQSMGTERTKHLSQHRARFSINGGSPTGSPDRWLPTAENLQAVDTHLSAIDDP